MSVSSFSETNDVNTGLLIEVWSKGMLWDNALGYHWIPLPAVKYSSQVGNLHHQHVYAFIPVFFARYRDR